MAESNIPPIPYKTQLTTETGILTEPWAKWFRQLFQRVGGNIALSNAELNVAFTNLDATVTTLSSTVSALSTSVTTLQSQVNGLNQGRTL